MKYDVAIIGAGPAGYKAAHYAAVNGLKVVIFERDALGGTCLNRGCIPTKFLVAEAHKGAKDMKDIMERKDAVVAQLREGIKTLLAHPNVTLVEDCGTLCGNTIDSEGYRGEDFLLEDSTNNQYVAANVIIATGSQPSIPPTMSLDPASVLTSTGLLEKDTLPSTMVIVGAGVIGMEFASIFNALGTKVTVLEYMPECLPMLDGDIAKRLRKLLEKRGITFVMKASVTAIRMHGNKTTVTYIYKEEEKMIECDEALLAVGRRPNLYPALNLDINGIEYTRKGINVNDDMQTNVKGIYAIGDVNGRMQLAHAASMQAVRAVNHILGKTDNIRFDFMPSAIFTTPEAACVGKTDAQMKAEGRECKVYKSYYRSNGRAVAMGETEGMVKIVADADDVIVGCHAYGAESSFLVQEMAALMNRETTIGQLRDIVHIHPTLSELLAEV